MTIFSPDTLRKMTGCSYIEEIKVPSSMTPCLQRKNKNLLD